MTRISEENLAPSGDVRSSQRSIRQGRDGGVPVHSRDTRSRTNRFPLPPAGSVDFISCMTLPSVKTAVLTPATLHGPASDSLHSTAYEISASAAFRRGPVNSRLLPFFTNSPGCTFAVQGPLPVANSIRFTTPSRSGSLRSAPAPVFAVEPK